MRSGINRAKSKSFVRTHWGKDPMNKPKLRTNAEVKILLIRCFKSPILALGSLLLLGVPALAGQFQEVTATAGLTNEHAYCMGVAWGDYDNDGYADLYIAVGATSKHVNVLYHNNRDGTFSRKTAAEAGPIVGDVHDSFGCAWVDFNNDGYPDMLVANGGFSLSRNDLYLNNGDGTFRSVSVAGITDKTAVTGSAAPADFNGDGQVDIFLPQGDSFSGPYHLRLYQASPGLVFTPLDLGPTTGFINDGVWGDYNNDGRPDLYTCNYTSPSALWRNDGQGHFTQVNTALPASGAILHAAWGDYDNDGNLDIVIGSTASTRLYRNNGYGGFVTAQSFTGPVPAFPAWADYDNDGHLDLLLVNGQDNAQKIFLYHNNGDGTFTAVTEPFTSIADLWLTGAWGDYDNDGFMDLVLTHEAGQNQLYHNLGNTNHWIKFKLVGTASNRDALGTKVRVKATIRGQVAWQMRELALNGSYAQNDLRPNFGLGDATNADLVRIEWPSGTIEQFSDLPAGQMVTIVEPSLRGVLGQDGKMHLSMTMSTNRVYQLETSSDLVTWRKLADFAGTPSGAAVEFVDPDAPSIQGSRFYRMR
jgi:hypothetical protein